MHSVVRGKNDDMVDRIFIFRNILISSFKEKKKRKKIISIIEHS